MLWTVAAILAMVWMLGLVTQVTLGGFLHLLLLISVGVVLIRMLQPRKSV